MQLTLPPLLRLLLPALFCPLCLTAGAAFAAEKTPTPILPISAQQAKALGIETETLARAGAGLAAGLPAEVRVPNEQLRVVAAPLAGMVVAIDVAAGQSVKKGQTLARLASPALLGAERDYLQAAQAAQLATQAARRDEQLFAEGIIAEARVQATRSAFEQASVGLAARREELRLAGVSDTALTSLAQQRRLPSEVLIAAPMAGVVLEQTVQTGQRVDAAAPLFRIGRLSPLWLEIQVPASLAASLREGLAVNVAVSGAAGNSSASGRIINVGRQIGAGSQTVTVRAQLDKGADRLSPGQMVEASIDVPVSSGAPAAGDAGKVFRVAQTALARIDSLTYVFVAEGEGFRAQPVNTVGQAGDYVLLQSPALNAQTRIATRGLSSLKSAWSVLRDSAESKAAAADSAAKPAGGK
ncbi:efflux RND transporter periplasmic adaptor subunit [Rhodocyclus tenuis]|uniref:RND family efflux transporter MFP subunit n=1 Tax=Rhodocyclus tenuis TaxID=1066 RepID=A0A840G7F6_RHOTE|nr:efflux RND transporter periplasmic adaptor subunit [Rhodocyclus tenuis]MBB4247806.1 RND family efflux transporter MFP subunit [Rhodocyclus tenuis]MBK1681077.1 hypothetical protein [Rhodocyclus tenuis]